ncbi:DUF1207 domain-containing protein [Planctomicrobium sp. SH661]|uniref:DUF1207 domain-containing protein n=1 Tax=Planctomicrobium sp. SH661 TaxID=3448124 RepID=UPI003F5C7197
MTRFALLKLICALAFLSGGLAAAHAESDWITQDSFIEWPESFKDDPVLPEVVDPTSIIQTEFLEVPIPEDNPAAMQAEPVFVEQVPQFAVPMTSAQLDQVSSYTWQVLPPGLLYHNYLAGEKEPRTAATWLWDKKRGLIWEAAVGSKWGLLRHGTQGTDAKGFQFDVEGAALVRIDPEEESDLEAADFRAGFAGTWRKGKYRWKFGYSHISSHVGDEYILKNPLYDRVNYVRDSLLAGMTYDFTPKFQGYGEIAYAVGCEGGEPVELQFGLQYSPAFGTGFRGAPFAAINGHLRQEYNFGGSVNVEAGWAWRGGASNSLFRFGFQHYNGQSMQWSFVNRYENMTGLGIWFDY